MRCAWGVRDEPPHQQGHGADMSELSTGTVTFVFTNIEGSTTDGDND
jgi:hypothetical protein